MSAAVRGFGQIMRVNTKASLMTIVAREGTISYATDVKKGFMYDGSTWNQLSTLDQTDLQTYLDAKADKTSLKTVAMTGSYTDLTNKPTIPTVPALATVATSGAYNDLSGKPTIPSGSYTDLTNKPTIPAAQVNSDWNSNSGVTQINNKPVIGKIYTTTGATGDAFAMPRKGVTNASGVATIYLTNNNTAGGTAVFSTIYEDGIIVMPVGSTSNFQVTSVTVSADKKTLAVTVNQLGSVLLGLVQLTTAAAGVEVRAMVMGK